MEGAASNRVSYQWRVQEGARPSSLIFRPNWGPKVHIFFLDRVPRLHLRVWMTGSPPPPLTEGLDPPLLIPMTVIAKASLRK